MSPFLPFSKPSISEEDLAAVAEVMRSGWLTTGPKVAAFEAAFGAFVGASSALAVASATGGMHLLLHALGIGPGDEVVTPSLTWVSTANLICLMGATPVFADIDRDTLMVTPQQLEAKITARTKAIIPVHYAGSAVDLDPMRDLAARHGIALIEDAAHAAGTRYKDRPVGASGTAVFSFHAIKNLTTGEGGMICTDDEALAATLKTVRFHGLGVDAYDRKTQGRKPQAEVLQPGFKYNLTDMAAALGLSQLARLEDINRRRASLTARYHRLLADVEGVTPLATPDYAVHDSRHLMIVRVTAPHLDRAAFMQGLADRGIGTGIHFRPIHLQHYYRQRFGLHEGLLPHTEWNGARIVSLPLFPDMSYADVDAVVAAVKEVVQ